MTEKPADAEILAEKRSEFRTKKVIRIEDDFFYVNENGGTGGAYEKGTDNAESITRTEARRLLLEMGDTPEEAAQKTRAR
jgi:hypothetical protein